MRATYNGAHSSQVALPGGKSELFDLNHWQTALRETEEEIGVPKTLVQHLKNLSPLYVPPSNFMVYPFLGFCTEEPTFRLDLAEVADTIEISLNDFINKYKTVTKKLTTSYMVEQEVRGFEINNHFVWGATAMMLSEIKELLKTTTSQA